MGNVWLGALLFADDLALIANTPEELQLMFNALEEFCNIWRLKINVSKLKLLIIVLLIILIQLILKYIIKLLK